MTTAQTPITAVAAPEAEPASEFGATVQDAQRLLRRATYVFVFFRVGSEIWDTSIVDVPKRAIAAQLKQLNALKPFPCELSLSASGNYILSVGHSTAIKKAAEARR